MAESWKAVASVYDDRMEEVYNESPDISCGGHDCKTKNRIKYVNVNVMLFYMMEQNTTYSVCRYPEISVYFQSSQLSSRMAHILQQQGLR